MAGLLYYEIFTDLLSLETGWNSILLPSPTYECMCDAVNYLQKGLCSFQRYFRNLSSPPAEPWSRFGRPHLHCHRHNHLHYHTGGLHSQGRLVPDRPRDLWFQLTRNRTLDNHKSPRVEVSTSEVLSGGNAASLPSFPSTNVNKWRTP